MRSRLLIASLIVACLAPVALAGDMLWDAWENGSPDRRELLTQCQQRLQAIRREATRGVSWTEGADVQWLLSQRVPAILVVGRDLETNPSGQDLDVLLYLAGRLGSSDLGAKLPPLLERASEEKRIKVVRTMAQLRDGSSVKALEDLLQRADSSMPEGLLCAAASGLGATANRKYLPLLRRTARLVRSDLARLRMDAALCRCGDAEAAKAITELLTAPKADRNLKVFAIAFCGDACVREAVPALGEIAAESPDKELSDQALEALLSITRFGMPAPSASGDPKDKPVTDMRAPVPPRSMSENVPLELQEPDRKKLVRMALDWWAEQQSKEVNERASEAAG